MVSLRSFFLSMFLVIAGELLFCCVSYGQNPSPPVWGFADLHTHPASFLGFGSDKNGNNGLIWGKPAHDTSAEPGGCAPWAPTLPCTQGLDLATSNQNLASDLPPCPTASIGPIALGFTHNNAAGIDFIKLATDSQIVSRLDGTSPGWTHQQQGYPSFEGPNNAPGWPTGLTVDHQVMHISSIKRAFDGGLRLMFASVTDDELLTDLWNQGFNLLGNTMPYHDSQFDYRSAVKQLTYITNLVNANSAWMQIVKTPSQARAAISANPPKLAVVLSLEMDSLSLSQIQSLVQQFGVAHVIPVHLVDNSFGGTAIYSDNFNGLSNFINGFPENLPPSFDPNVNFQLGTPVASLQQITISGQLNISPTLGISMSALALAGAAPYGPDALALVTAAIAAANVPSPLGGSLLPQVLPTGALGYQPNLPNPAPLQTPGTVNSKDLNQSRFLALMRLGLLLDIAHMGEKTALSALNLATQYHYPLMDSHTGIRCDNNCSTPFGSPASPATSVSQIDERSLPTSQLQIIRDLGGVIGLGEVPAVEPTKPPTPDPDPVTTWINNYKIALSLMGGKGVALGTDADGLSPLFQSDTIPTNYPITVATQFGCANCQPLWQYQLGNRTYNFQNDGIATYGLLPDFIQSASQSRPIPVPIVYNTKCTQDCQSTYNSCVKTWNPNDYPRGTQSPCGKNEISCVNNCPHTGGGSHPGPAPTEQIAALFHTAEDTIEMWEAVEKALFIITQSLSGTVGETFSQGLTAKGGTPPLTWSVSGSQSQSPAPGLTLHPNGAIYGSPTSPGSYSFTAVVQDSSTPPMSASQPVGIYVSPETCLQNPKHELILCGSAATKTCVVPPAGCPTPSCGPSEELVDGSCQPKGSHPK
jgi:microsomal dipeptidase-like Zn-dependent dipeptidase